MVSVLIPCYNYGRYVGQAIESVLAQTHGDLELIVIDNGSTDDSWQVIQGYKDSRIKTFQIEKNEGIVKAWRFGLEQCTGEWFSFLSADDYLVPQKHEILLQYLAAHPEVDAVGGYVDQVDQNGQPYEGAKWMEMVINEPRDLNSIDAWMVRHYLCMPTAVYRRRLCASPISGINAVSDYDFHVQLLRRGCRFAQLQEVLASYRWHTTNTSGSVREQSTAALQFAFCYARQFLPYLRESGQEARAGEAIIQFFDLYSQNVKAASHHDLGGIMLCMFWPEWVEQHCLDYHALVALDWETRQDSHLFHAVRAMADEAFLKWAQQEPPPAAVSQPVEGTSPLLAKPKRHQKHGLLRDAGRKLERKIRHFIRRKKDR
jgi:GT2 family glycosyltransferase